MAEVDALRRRLRLNKAELAAVETTGITSDGVGQESERLLVEALTAAEVIKDGRIPGWVNELLGIVARPALRIAIDVLTIDRLAYSIWATPSGAVTGTPMDDGTTELATIDSIMIPFAITQIVGLRRRPPGAGRGPIRLRASAFAAIEQQAAAGIERDSLRQSLSIDDLTDGDLDALVDLVGQRRTSWRISTVWSDGTRRHTPEGLHVLDAGEAGLWIITAADWQAGDPMLTLSEVTAGVVWERLMGLLPRPQPAGSGFQ